MAVAQLRARSPPLPTGKGKNFEPDRRGSHRAVSPMMATAAEPAVKGKLGQTQSLATAAGREYLAFLLPP